MPARRHLLAAGLALGAGWTRAEAATTEGADAGLLTRRSAHDVATTIARFRAATLAAGWVMFGEIDHAAAAAAAGLPLPARTVLLFGNPKTGTPVMRTHPTLALDLPMRALVWQDDAGGTYLTRSTGADLATRLFARHGVTVAPEGQAATEAFLAGLVSAATG